MNTQRDLAVQLRASIKRNRLIATRLIAEIASATPPMIMVFRDQIIILECQEDCLAFIGLDALPNLANSRRFLNRLKALVRVPDTGISMIN
jgi:hypothetical protein